MTNARFSPGDRVRVVDNHEATFSTVKGKTGVVKNEPWLRSEATLLGPSDKSPDPVYHYELEPDEEWSIAADTQFPERLLEVAE